MPMFKEWFNPSRVVSDMGALKFTTSIFRDDIRYPHYEMDKALQLYEQRPMVNAGVKQFVRFVTGNEIKAKSEDTKSQDFLQKWIDQRPLLKKEIFNFVTSTVVTGNGYLEPTYVTSNNGVTIVDNVFSMPDPSRIYYNLDSRKTEDDFWLFEVPIEVKMFPFQGQEYKPKFWRVNYVRGSILFQKLVYSIPIHKSKIRHLKIGWSRDGLYGRGFVTACVDDGEILTEILKNLAIISRTRALNTKLVSIGTETDRATPQDLLKLDFDLKNRRENEHILINKPISEVDLSHQGKYDKMEGTLDYLRREVMGGLVPNFITAWNEGVNRATASEIKIPFQLELDAYKEDVLTFLKQVIIGSLRQAYDWLADDLAFDFGVIDLTSQDERMGYASTMFSNNVLTLNEYRTAAGYDPVDGGDVWGYQLPSIPLDRQTMSQTTTTKTDTTDQAGTTPTQKPQQPQMEFAIPRVSKKVKTKSNVTLTEVPNSPSFSEKASIHNGVKTDDDLSFDEVFTELYNARKEVESMMKKFKIGSMIKTKREYGSKLLRLQKGDKKDVLDVIKDSLGRNLTLEKTPEEFKDDIKKEIQEFEKGKPKYEDYVIERIARTELSRIREAHKLLEYKEQGYSKVKHITHRSKESGKKDLEFDGKVFDIDHLLSEKGESDRIPLHPHCRCQYIPYE